MSNIPLWSNVRKNWTTAHNNVVQKCHCLSFHSHVFPPEDKRCPLTETSSMAFPPPVICQSPQTTKHTEWKKNVAPFGCYHAEKRGVNRSTEGKKKREPCGGDFLSKPLMNKFSTVTTTRVSAHASPSDEGGETENVGRRGASSEEAKRHAELESDHIWGGDDRWEQRLDLLPVQIRPLTSDQILIYTLQRGKRLLQKKMKSWELCNQMHLKRSQKERRRKRERFKKRGLQVCFHAQESGFKSGRFKKRGKMKKYLHQCWNLKPWALFEEAPGVEEKSRTRGDI